MKYTEFKSSLENAKPFSVYLFEGKDAFFRERGLSLLKNKFVQEPELNYVVLDDDLSVEKLISSLNGYPFMSEKRLTAIREFYPKQDFFKKGFKEYLENPFEQSILVILNEKPCEALKKFSSVCVVDCSKADKSILVRWIKAECSKFGLSIEAETASELCDYCLSDMTRIELEVQKLCAYSLDKGVVEKSDLVELVNRDTEYKIYQMTDYIATKQFDLALSVIKDMLGKGEPAQVILVSIYNYFRRLLHASISNMDDLQLAKAFGIESYAVKKIKKQAQAFKKRSLKQAVDMLTDVDYMAKSGRAEIDSRMWLTIFKIMTDK